MKRIIKHLLLITFLFFGGISIHAQSIKVNAPLLFTGSPNIGFEYALTNQMALSADALWIPYLFKKHEEVFRVFQGTAEVRYYVNPQNYYTSKSCDGFYIGPYAMFGNFNIGLYKHSDPLRNYRRRGWAVSGGITTGYKISCSSRWALDLNIGLGYAHIQYNKYYLGGEYAHLPLERKSTKSWIGPTKFGVNIIYNIFR